MITFAPRFPAIWLSETYARSDNLSRLTYKLASVGKKNKNVIYLPRSVRIGKNCALGPRAQFFPIRASRPVNNIYIYILLEGLVCSIVGYFYESRRILASP